MSTVQYRFVWACLHVCVYVYVCVCLYSWVHAGKLSQLSYLRMPTVGRPPLIKENCKIVQVIFKIKKKGREVGCSAAQLAAP